MNGGAVFALISQADLLVRHEVGTVLINDTVVNNGQLVPVLSGVEVRKEPRQADKPYVDTPSAAEILSQ